MVVSGKKKTTRYLQGDRFRGSLGEGTVTKVGKGIFPYEITWCNGRSEVYSAEQIERYGYQLLPPEPGIEDIEEEELSLWEQFGEEDFSREQEAIAPKLTWKDWRKGDRVCSEINGKHGVIEKLKFRPQAVFVLWDGTTDPFEYSPTDLEMLRVGIVPADFSREQKRDRSSQPCLDNLTSAPVSVLDSPLQDSKPEDSPLQDSAKSTTTAEISSVSDTQVCQSLETSSDTTGEPLEGLTSLQLPLLASLSVSKESDSQQTTQETVSLTSSKRSPKSSRRTSRSKTSKACFHVHVDLGANSDTLEVSCPTFPNAGTMSSGSWSAADILDRPSLESGCSWLESPNGLSAQGRVPGQSRLEAQLKSDEYLQDGQCINPAFLEDAFEIPLGWCDRLVSRSAIQLLEESEKRSVTVSTPESPPSPSVESSILTESLKTEEELTPVDESAVGKHYWCDRLDVTVTIETIHPWRVTPRAKEITKAARCRPWWGKFPDVIVIQLDELVEIEELSCPLPTQIPEIPITGISQDSHPATENSHSLEKPKKQQVGSLYQYTANKADKAGHISTYPKVEGDRSREEDAHWYWGFSYVEKQNGKWRDKSAAVPRKKLAEVREALRAGKGYQYILQKVLGKD